MRENSIQPCLHFISNFDNGIDIAGRVKRLRTGRYAGKDLRKNISHLEKVVLIAQDNPGLDWLGNGNSMHDAASAKWTGCINSHR
jgi:hypothetical protein